MADSLIEVWAFIVQLFTDPRIAAAVPAFIISLLIGNYKSALTCAVIAFCVARLVLYITGWPIETSSGIGAGMALMGVHGIQERVTQLDINYVINLIVSQFKRRK